MFYDRALDKLLLVDCYALNANEDHTSIWGWNGQGWDMLATGGPRGRDVGGAAYDSKRDKVVVYGGLFLGQTDCSRETWEWDSSGWTKLDVDSPGQCNHFKLTYDEARGVVLLFGGQKENLNQLDETWAWDGVAWRQITPTGNPPRSRAHFGFVYNRASQQVLLYGGYNGSVFGDFWSWNGAAWAQSQQTQPGARSHLGMAYNSAADALLIFGGAKTASSFTSLTDETWLYKDGAWTQATSPTSPSPRGLPALAYDPTRKQTLLYGGFDANDNYGDTWAWNGSAWTCLANCP